jgi:hypothetical protein
MWIRGLRSERSALLTIAVFVAVGVAALAGAQKTSAAAVGGARVDDDPANVALALASPVRDGVARSAASRQSLQGSTWGGTFTTSQGHQIAMYASLAYRADNQWLQDWANWLDDLPNGSEFSRLTVYLVPEKHSYYDDLESLCGPGAAGCYFPDTQRLIAPGSNLSDGTQMESVLAHEYGHHIANNRSNPPWEASTWGPKRWATDMNICKRVRAGTAFPGDEDTHYRLNPGEAWAEAYRQMVSSSMGLPAEPWAVVDESFYPSSLALTDAQKDALDPWSARDTSTLSGAQIHPVAERASELRLGRRVGRFGVVLREAFLDRVVALPAISACACGGGAAAAVARVQGARNCRAPTRARGSSPPGPPAATGRA